MSTRSRNRLLPGTVLVLVGLLIVAVAFVLDVRRVTTAEAAPPGTTATGSTTSTIGSRPAPPKLVMIGDSITYSAEAALARSLSADGFAPSVLAYPGHLFRDRLLPARDAAATDPDIVVINLGTNDHICLEENAGPKPCLRYPGFTPDDLLVDIDAMLGVFPNETTCIVAVEPTNAPETEALLPQLQSAGRIDGIADWGTLSRERPEYLWDPVGHINDQGIAAYAQFISAEAHRICDGAAAPDA